MLFNPGLTCPSIPNTKVTAYSRCQNRTVWSFLCSGCLSFLPHSPFWLLFSSLLLLSCVVWLPVAPPFLVFVYDCVSLLTLVLLCSFLCYPGPATWAMATSKPDIMIILLSKLIEEGDSFYKVRERSRHSSIAFRIRDALLIPERKSGVSEWIKNKTAMWYLSCCYSSRQNIQVLWYHNQIPTWDVSYLPF